MFTAFSELVFPKHFLLTLNTRSSNCMVVAHYNSGYCSRYVEQLHSGHAINLSLTLLDISGEKIAIGVPEDMYYSKIMILIVLCVSLLPTAIQTCKP